MFVTSATRLSTHFFTLVVCCGRGPQLRSQALAICRRLVFLAQCKAPPWVPLHTSTMVLPMYTYTMGATRANSRIWDPCKVIDLPRTNYETVSPTPCWDPQLKYVLFLPATSTRAPLLPGKCPQWPCSLSLCCGSGFHHQRTTATEIKIFNRIFNVDRSEVAKTNLLDARRNPDDPGGLLAGERT